MQKWIDDNDILLYSTHNEGKSVVAAWFMKTLNGKEMTADDNKFC